MKLLLDAHNIKQYIQDRTLLNIEQLHVYHNDRIGLAGENFSGKTTLLHILNQDIIPEEGLVTQYTQVELIPQLKDMDTTNSGGEVTQMYIHKSFDKKPELLLADEPTTNLDTKSIENLEQQ
nr:hypothetical protein KUHPSE09_00330 [Staphylococcus epidermidis]